MRPSIVCSRSRGSRGGLLIVCLVVGWLTCHALYAAESLRADVPFGEHLHRRFGRENGLPSDWINDIIQTRDHYIWIGTDRGLVRYDGLRFKLFHRANSPQLPFDEIHALYEDSDGSVWIGTTRGVARYRPGQPPWFEQVATFAGRAVRAFYRDRQATLWIGTDEQTYASTRGAGFRPVENAPWDVRAICEGRDGTLWFGSHVGLFFRDGETFQQVLHEHLPKDAPLHEGVPTRRVNTIYCDRPGGLWIGTNRILLRRDRNGQLTTCGEALSSQQIYDILRTHNGGMYVAARFGVYRLAADQSFEEVLDEPSAFCLLEDHAGGLWIGYGDNRGLHYYRNRHLESVWNDGLVACVDADTEGNVWFGTDAGLCRLRDGKIERYGTADGLPDLSVMAIAQGRDKKLWIGTSRGFAQWSNGSLVRAELPAETATMNIGVAFEDSTGSLWFALGTEGGYLWRGGTLHELHELASGRIHWFWEQSAGCVWIGHEAGLFQHRDGQLVRLGEREFRSLQDPRFLCHFATADGTLWMGTSNGLARYRAGRLEAFPPDCGLLADNIERLAADGDGNLWFGGRDGLFHASLEEFDAVAAGRLRQVTSYRIEGFDRFPPVRAFSQACLVRDGELWLLQRGLWRLHTRPFLVEYPAPTVQVEEISVDGAGQRFGEHFAYQSGRRRLSIRFAVQPFTDHSHAQVRYRLDPYDAQWVHSQGYRIAQYTDLRPGDYRFRLSARHGNGSWVEAAQTPAFTVLPNWWETTLFRLAVAVACVGLGLAYGGLRVRRMRRANDALQREIAWRKHAEEESRRHLDQLARVSRAASMGELATSIAHEIKQPLFAILTDAETAARLLDNEDPDIEQIRDALHVITAGGKRVTEIVDRIRSLVSKEDQPRQPVDMNKVVTSVLGFLNAELHRRGIGVVTELADELPAVEGNEIELQQVVLNLLLNGAQALKETEVASPTLWVSTSVDGDAVVLAVRDCGVGLRDSEMEKVFEPFYTTKRNGIGMGLTINRTIVRAHGGRIWATANADRGATFHVSLPISRFDESRGQPGRTGG